MERTTQVTHLDSRECWSLLRTTPFGRLALTAAAAGQPPDVFPVNFRVYETSIVFRTAQGAKLAAVQNTPVTFEADNVNTDTGLAWSVVAKGQAVEATPDEDLASKVGTLLFSWEPGTKDHLVRITVGSITGRQFKLQVPHGWDLSLDEALRAGLE